MILNKRDNMDNLIIEYIDVDKLLPYARNARTHSKKQVQQIASSIVEFGFLNPVLVDKNLTIIAGHGRVLAAQTIALNKIPVVRVEHLTDAQRRAYTLVDNQLALNSGWENDLLKIEIDELKALDFDMELLGFDDLDELLDSAGGTEGNTDPDEIPEVQQNIHGVVRGDIWQLGDHRLMCGDSTSKDDVERLMNGEKADMMFTDPPYGVSYVGKTKDALTIESDDLSPDELKNKNKLWFDRVDEAIRDGAYVLATVPAGPLHLIFAQDWKDRGWLRQIMVWNKSSMVMGHSEYHYKHEPILFGWKPGDRLKNKDRTKTTVWDFDRPSRSEQHPTMKPVEMWKYGIENHTVHNNLIFEPFSG